MHDELIAYLAENIAGTVIQWGGKPIHQLKKLGFSGVNLPYTDYVFDRCLMLPMNTSLRKDEVIYITDKIKEFYNA